MDEHLITLLVGGAGTAITGLAGFIGYLFKEERKEKRALQEDMKQLHKAMKEDDEKVIEVIFSVHRFLSEQGPANRELQNAIQRVETSLQEIHTIVGGRLTRARSAPKGRS